MQTAKSSPLRDLSPVKNGQKYMNRRNSKFKLQDWVHYTKKYKGVNFKQRVGEIFPSKYNTADLE